MSGSTGAIVAGVDGSEAALAAVRWAAAEAAARKAPLRLVSGTDPAPFYYTGGLLATQDVYDAVETAAVEQLAEAAAVAREVAPDVEVTRVRDHTGPIPLLLGESERARTVVLGASGKGGFEGMLVGSVAVAVATRGASPVAVVREAADPDGPVVVGVDGSAVSVAAVGAAFEEADWRGVPLVAVHAWRDIEYVNGLPSQLALLQDDPPQHEHERVLAEALAGWQEKFPDVEVQRVLAKDRPRRELLGWSEKAQLVVVGSRGRGGFRGALLGSTSQALLHHARCTVLVVRH